MRQLLPLLLLSACLQVLFSPATNASEQPNIVMIISDDQAWGDYSFMDHPQIQTPHLDRLAKQGLTYTRGYVPDSLCRPSLVTIISGLYPHQHGIVGNDPPVPAHLVKKGKRKPFANPDYIKVREEYINYIDHAPKLATMLKKKGYVSHQSGKWWEGHYSRGGFDQGMTHGDRSRGGRHGDDGLVIGRKGLQPVTDFINEATEQNKPFFVYYAPFLPHTPHTPPQHLLEKYKALTPHLPVAKYWAMCDWFDETCGELIDYVEKKGLTEETLFVYVTDNGWINQETASRYAPRSKRSQYEGGTRTPIIFKWKGQIEPQFNTTDLASSIDIVPTILNIVGLEKTEQMQGIDLLDSQAVAERTAIYGEIFEHDIRHMTNPIASLRYRWIIEGDYKLIVPHLPVETDGQLELFHITADPHEEHNIAKQHPELVNSLTSKLDSWWEVD